jgi:hypothetical protein
MCIYSCEQGHYMGMLPCAYGLVANRSDWEIRFPGEDWGEFYREYWLRDQIMREEHAAICAELPNRRSPQDAPAPAADSRGGV